MKWSDIRPNYGAQDMFFLTQDVVHTTTIYRILEYFLEIGKMSSKRYLPLSGSHSSHIWKFVVRELLICSGVYMWRYSITLTFPILVWTYFLGTLLQEKSRGQNSNLLTISSFKISFLLFIFPKCWNLECLLTSHITEFDHCSVNRSRCIAAADFCHLGEHGRGTVMKIVVVG